MSMLHRRLLFFTVAAAVSFIHPPLSRLKGSTVNMNIMGWVYSKIADLVGSPGHTALGASLMLGEFSSALAAGSSVADCVGEEAE